MVRRYTKTVRKKWSAYQARPLHCWLWRKVRIEAKRHAARYETRKTRIAYHCPKRSGSSWRLSFHSTKVSTPTETGNQGGNLKKSSKKPVAPGKSEPATTNPVESEPQESASILKPDQYGRSEKTVGNEKRSDGRNRASSDVDHDPDDKKRTYEPQESEGILKSDQNGPTENAGIHAIQGKIRQSRWKGTKNEKIEPTIKIGLGWKACRCGSSIGQHKRREAWRTEQAGILYFGRC